MVKQLALNAAEITEVIKNKIKHFEVVQQARHEGTIVSLKDGIVRLHGLESVMQGEMVAFENNLYGLALNLERESVGVVALGAYEQLAEGQTAKCTGKILEVPVGEALLGRVVDALGNPIDAKGAINAPRYEAIEKVAPGVISRQSVSEPLQTGLNPSMQWYRSAVVNVN